MSGLTHVNKAILVGTVTRDPELKEFKESCVAELRLALNEFVGPKNNRTMRSEYVTVKVWNAGGRAAVKFVKKGWTVFVDGKLKTREWTNSEGEKRRVLEINCASVGFLARPNEKGPAPEPTDEELGIPPGEADLDETDTLDDWEPNF